MLNSKLENVVKGQMTKRLWLVVKLIGIAFMGAMSQSAFAMQTVSDAQLAKQSGGTKYFTGACSQDNDDVTCSPTPAIALAPNCGTCLGDTHGHCGIKYDSNDTQYQGDRYQDASFKYKVCNSNSETDESNATCKRGGGLVYVTLYRHIYSASGMEGCNAEERPASPFIACDKPYCWDRHSTSGAWDKEDTGS